ncbi:MAG: apolipoprotein N-acyltransferase [Parasphingorhabdus sp.]
MAELKLDLVRKPPVSLLLTGVLPLVLGAIFPFAFSPFDYNWLAIVLLTSWLWVLSLGRPVISGFAFGIGWFGIGAWWLVPMVELYGELGGFLSFSFVVLLGIFLAMFSLLWAWLIYVCGGRGPWLLLAFPSAAIITEWLRGHVLSGLPWTSLGNLLLDSPAVGWVTWFGVYGAAAGPALLAAALYLLCFSQYRKWGFVGLAITALCIWLSPQVHVASSQTYVASIIQANLPSNHNLRYNYQRWSINNHAMLSNTLNADAALILWPESSIPGMLDKDTEWFKWIGNLVRQWPAPLLAGGFTLVNKDQPQNGAFGFAADTFPDYQFSGKQHLLPLAEYLPSWLEIVADPVRKLDYVSATDQGVITLKNISYGTLICYESLFPEQARSRVLNGAQVLVNLSNDVWFGNSPALWQGLQSVRMRAVETGRYVLRAANTGISAIIAPDGRVTHQTPWGQATVLSGEFRSLNTITRYTKWGDFPLLLTTLILVLCFFLQKRNLVVKR